MFLYNSEHQGKIWIFPSRTEDQDFVLVFEKQKKTLAQLTPKWLKTEEDSS